MPTKSRVKASRSQKGLVARAQHAGARYRRARRAPRARRRRCRRGRRGRRRPARARPAHRAGGGRSRRARAKWRGASMWVPVWVPSAHPARRRRGRPRRCGSPARSQRPGRPRRSTIPVRTGTLTSIQATGGVIRTPACRRASGPAASIAGPAEHFPLQARDEFDGRDARQEHVRSGFGRDEA